VAIWTSILRFSGNNALPFVPGRQATQFGPTLMIYVLVTYDVSTKTPAGQKRLRKVAQYCEDYGQRVQNSVFEMKVDWSQWTMIKAGLIDLIESNEDSLRFYSLGSNWQHKVEHHGVQKGFDIEGPLIA
jgi:CRISPR-associated protein Cas2